MRENGLFRALLIFAHSRCAKINGARNLMRLRYLNKQSFEYSRVLNVSDAVHSISSLHKLLSSYRDRDVFITLSNILPWSAIQKEYCLNAGSQPEIFQWK